MTQSEVMAIVQDAFDALREADLVQNNVSVDETTDLLGPETILDSIAFITFIVELEDRLQAELGDDTHIAVTEIHDYNPEEARLTVGVLVDYILRTQEPKESPRD
jgi:acyl carrier protein